MDDLAEESYWRFDARRKGCGPWKEAPQSERDAYKAELAALLAQLAARDAEVGRLREALEAVDAWDINWADGLDENVERIKDMVRAALKGEDAT